MPGALTPTEIVRAHAMGVAAVKVFPASVGGPGYLRALRGPLAHVPLVPTGGIAIDDVGAYLSAGAACVGLGAALVGERAAPHRRGAGRDRRAGGRCCLGGDAPAVTGAPDVVAIGETMLSLVALDGPLDEATSFHATHGGAESNTCVALARLGRSAAWVGRVGDDPIGDRILADLGREEVDLSWTTEGPRSSDGADAPRHRRRRAVLPSGLGGQRALPRGPR